MLRLHHAPKGEGEAALEGLYTCFYDEDAGRWESLERIGIDTESYQVESISTRFTDMINSTLTLPEGPKPVEFDLNSVTARPDAGIAGIEGLEGDWNGSASFSIPLKLPIGLGGATPQLATSYNPGRSPSVLGLGFNLSISSIETDTRFGVPSYDQKDFYLLDGSELVLISDSSGANPQEYRERQEGGFKLSARGGLTNEEERAMVSAREVSKL